MIDDGIAQVARGKRKAFWEKWIRSSSILEYEVPARLHPERLFPKWAIELMETMPERDPKEPVRVLDLGSGPVSALGTHWPEHSVELIAVDRHEDLPLAELERLVPIDRQPRDVCEAHLLNKAAHGELDLVYSWGFLESTRNPMVWIRAAATLLRPGGSMVLFYPNIDSHPKPGSLQTPWVFFSEDHVLWVTDGRCMNAIEDLAPDLKLEAVCHEDRVVRAVLRKRDGEADPEFPSTDNGLPYSLLRSSLVSMHIPKTAGSSFRAVLENLYGDRLMKLYEPCHSRRQQAVHFKVPAHVRCVHGHFQAEVFRRKFDHPLSICWFRDPVSRLISSYHQFDRNPPAEDEEQEDAFVRDFHEHRPSLLQFACMPEIRRQMLWYLNCQQLKDLHFIGITERFEDSLRLFAATFGLQLDVASPRINAHTGDREEFTEEERSEVNSLLSEEIAVYQRAVQLFDARLNKLGIDRAL